MKPPALDSMRSPRCLVMRKSGNTSLCSGLLRIRIRSPESPSAQLLAYDEQTKRRKGNLLIAQLGNRRETTSLLPCCGGADTITRGRLPAITSHRNCSKIEHNC